MCWVLIDFSVSRVARLAPSSFSLTVSTPTQAQLFAAVHIVEITGAQNSNTSQGVKSISWYLSTRPMCSKPTQARHIKPTKQPSSTQTPTTPISRGPKLIMRRRVVGESRFFVKMSATFTDPLTPKQKSSLRRSWSWIKQTRKSTRRTFWRPSARLIASAASLSQ